MEIPMHSNSSLKLTSPMELNKMKTNSTAARSSSRPRAKQVTMNSRTKVYTISPYNPDDYMNDDSTMATSFGPKLSTKGPPKVYTVHDNDESTMGTSAFASEYIHNQQFATIGGRGSRRIDHDDEASEGEDSLLNSTSGEDEYTDDDDDDDDHEADTTYISSCHSEDDGEDDDLDPHNNHNSSFVTMSSPTTSHSPTRTPDTSYESTYSYDTTNWDDVCHRLATNDDTLVELDIKVACLPADVAEVIARHLSTNYRLKKLIVHLQKRNVEDEVDPVLLRDYTTSLHIILLEGLVQNVSICHLHIINCTLDKHMAAVWARAFGLRRLTRKPLLSMQANMQTNPTQLLSICLDKCLFVDASGLSIFLLGCQHNPNLISFKIRDCDLSHPSNLDVVATSLPLFNKLQYLTLNRTWISASGFQFLSSNLQYCPSLLHLNLSHNQNVNIAALVSQSTQSSSTLSFIANLQTLELESCDLLDHDIERLAQGFLLLQQSTNATTGSGSGGAGDAASCNLTSLNLSHNLFTNVTPLRELLQASRKIRSLSVNHLSNRRQKPLLDCLRYNNSVFSRLGGIFSQETSLAILETKDMIEEATETVAGTGGATKGGGGSNNNKSGGGKSSSSGKDGSSPSSSPWDCRVVTPEKYIK